MNFKIKEGYNHRTEAAAFDDTPYKDQFQREVYMEVLKFVKENRLNSIIDIGCGSGYKLVRYLGKYDIEGLEIEPTLSWLKKNYPHNKWVDRVDPDKEYDVVICADVIEHLYDPTELLKMFSSMKATTFFISTPERDIVRGPEDMGPPRNETHFREWNTKEFVELVSDYLEVKEVKITNQAHGTLMLRAIKKAQPVLEPTEPFALTEDLPVTVTGKTRTRKKK